MTTPGQLRQHARTAREQAKEYRRQSHETTSHYWKVKWLDDADKREETADFYDELASRGEIEVEYEIINEHREAAE
jgi:hypothetical protein